MDIFINSNRQTYLCGIVIPLRDEANLLQQEARLKTLDKGAPHLCPIYLTFFKECKIKLRTLICSTTAHPTPQPLKMEVSFDYTVLNWIKFASHWITFFNIQARVSQNTSTLQ